MRYQGVILDIDGTLVDSNQAHVDAWVEILRKHGHDVPAERIWPLIGMGADNLLPRVVGIDKDSAEGKKISEERSELFKERYMSELRPFPQVRELVSRIRDTGASVVVASSSKEDEVHQLLEIAGVSDLIEERTSASETKRSKPDPDLVQVALGKLEMDPDRVVMLGDTPYDIEAAGKAGVPVIAMRCGGFPDDKLKDAIAIYDDPADLLARFDESPLGG
jgi:HAD superfamily hydrolase (TIGR01509 family)